MEATDDVLDTVGKNVVRLSKVRAGQDPMESLLHKDSDDANDISSTPTATSSRTMKRKLDSSDDKSSSKVSRRTCDSQATVSVRRVLDPIDENDLARNLPNDEKARIRCTTFAMRMLSSATLRPHALIDCDRLPPYQGWDKGNPTNFFNGLKMTLETSEKSKIIIVLGGIIHRQCGLIGRDICVVPACSSAWPDQELVVKISWPSIHRDSEKLMDAAKAKADEMASEGKRHWVLDHLPEIPHSQDFRSDDKTTSQRRLVELSNKADVDGTPFIYKEHFLRISVSESLFPITGLTDVKDIAQGFFDIFRCHHLLYEKLKILHRDISLNNMMYRKRHDNIEQKFQIVGVLNDFDLSSVIPLKGAAFLHRTGTPPYMAHELLGQSDVGHLYRHDIEAFYYVLLILCCRYEIVQSAGGKVVQDLQSEQAKMPFAQWYDRTISWQELAAFKHHFLTGVEPISPSKSFSAFLPWLNAIQFLFRQGLFALGNSKISETQLPSYVTLPGTMQPSVPFDNETLGGYITSEYMLQIMSEIDGHSVKRSGDR
ncbi:hypothetical protein IW262DRAFT_1497677 [Armillaria fumosa]|nr:hypothetical protein IW262DRAFT_1497677 [Armillaria fumosa]